MPQLQTGSIDYMVDVTLTEPDLDRIEHDGSIPLSQKGREDLRQLKFSWCERRSMKRPDYAMVTKILDELIGDLSRGDTKRFLSLISHLALESEDTNPSNAFVHDALSSELDIAFEPSWRERIEVSADVRAFARSQLTTMRSRLREAYGGRKGKARDHDLGWVIARLATIYEAADGKITASWQINPAEGPSDPLWVVTSKFIRFAQAFISQLPENRAASGVDVVIRAGR